MKRFLFFIGFIVLLFCSTVLSGQRSTGSIKGKIITSDGSPAFVTVELKKLKKITATDNEGNFKLINLPSLQDTLILTSVQSQIRFVPVALAKNETLDLGTIYQLFTFGQLQNIEVAGRTTHSYKSDYSFLGTKTQSAYIDIPQSVSSITKELIKDKMEFTLEDAVGEASGVNNYSGYDEYTIRGFKAENAKLINGLRGYSTSYTSAMLVNIERIEIVKGPAATLYGNSDPGGTINLVTKKPLAQKESELNFFGGSWDHFRAEGDVTGPLNKSKTLLYRFNAGYDNTHSFRKQLFAKSYELSPSLSFIPNEKIQVNLDFSLSHINTILDRGQPGFRNDFSLNSTPINLVTSQPGDYLHETDFATNVLFSYRLNSHISFNSGYLNYITKQNTAEHGVHSYITDDSVNLYFSNWYYHTITNTFTNYFTFRFSTGKLSHQLLAGYDYIKSSVRLDQKYYENADQFGEGSGIVNTFSLKNPKYIAREINNYNLSDYNSDASAVDPTIYHTQGIYVQDQISVDKWKLLVGLREEFYKAGEDEEPDSTESNDDNENVFLPRIGLVYELKTGVSLYATYNKGFDPFEASTSTQVFDAPFKPITSELLETGAKANFFNNKLAASIALYQLTLRNVAVNADNISNPNLYVQEGEHRSRGFETEVNGNIMPSLSISASYSYCIARIIKSKIISMEGSRVENSPINTSNTWIKYIFMKGRLKGFGIAVGHSQVGARNTLEQGLTLPAYLVLNSGVSYTSKHLSIALNLDNITNKTYWIAAYNTVNKWPGKPGNIMVRSSYNF